MSKVDHVTQSTTANVKFSQVGKRLTRTDAPGKAVGKTPYAGDYVMPGATLWERLGQGGENLLFLVGTVSVLSYFFFAFGRKHIALKSSANLGRWYLMIALGAFFGNTFMTRLSALIERVHFLVAEWLHISQM